MSPFVPKVHLFENSLLKILAQLHWDFNNLRHLQEKGCKTHLNNFVDVSCFLIKKTMLSGIINNKIVGVVALSHPALSYKCVFASVSLCSPFSSHNSGGGGGGVCRPQLPPRIRPCLRSRSRGVKRPVEQRFHQLIQQLSSTSVSLSVVLWKLFIKIFNIKISRLIKSCLKVSVITNI